jgi:hypothetical protein
MWMKSNCGERDNASAHCSLLRVEDGNILYRSNSAW